MGTEETLHIEDLDEGDTFDCGSLTVEREEILEFARRYDPQPFHVDEEAAAASMWDGLIGSGWLTAALSARLLVTGYMNRTASVGGRGIDDLRWHRPVRAGDELSVGVEVVDTDAGDHPDYGDVSVRVTTTDGDGEVVQTMVAIGLVAKRGA